MGSKGAELKRKPDQCRFKPIYDPGYTGSMDRPYIIHQDGHGPNGPNVFATRMTKEHATIAAEALNVATETGCTPKELQAQRDALVAMCTELVAHLDYCGWGDSWERECAEGERLPQRAEELLAKVKGA